MHTQKNIRVDLLKDLYKEIPKATTKDIASAIEFLKRAREVRTGKTQKRREARKKYYQVLIDPNRAELIEKAADKRGMRGTAWVRKVTYEALQREFPSSEYKIAEAKDELMWRQSVQRRIEGRKQTK